MKAESEEIWKDIPNYEGIYQVSNLGRVKVLMRISICKGWGRRVRNERLMKQIKASKGYYFVNLTKDGMSKMLKTHQLVAICFLNHVPNGYKIVVDHINNNPLDNRVENLQLISQRENKSKDRLGTSKYVGVFWSKQNKKWRAQIMVLGKQKHLGYFTDEYEAHLAYQEELKKLIEQ